MAPFVVLDPLHQAFLDEVEALPAMSDVPPELPADAALWGSLSEPFGCDCDCSCEPAEEPGWPSLAEVREHRDRVRWAVPGVWDDEPVPLVMPPVGVLVARVQDAIGAVSRVAPVSLDPAVALVEVQALQAAVQGLRVLLLARVADVTERKLFEMGGFHSTGGWLAQVAPDAMPADRTLAGRLGGLPVLHAAVLQGRVALRNAKLVGTALSQVGRYLDRPDGLIDGQPAEPLLAAMADNCVELIGRAQGGLDEGVVAALAKRVAGMQEHAGSQAARVEGAMVLLAEHLSGRTLEEALQELVFAVVPNLLEAQQQRAEAKRGVSARPNADGSWTFEGRLTPECGDRFFLALAAEARRDPQNPVDTLARQHTREQALEDAGHDRFLSSGQQLGPEGELEPLPAWEWQALAGLSEGSAAEHAEQTRDLQLHTGMSETEAAEVALLVPRTRSRRVHDALDRLLTRYLGAGLGGVHDKIPVQLTITVPVQTVEGQPGALPARSDTGRPLARSLLARWWCDAQLTSLILSRGWQPLGDTHHGRTSTSRERRALHAQYDHRCAGTDCCPDHPDPLQQLVPHHVKRFAEHGRTLLSETLLVCDRLHKDLHLGGKTLRLRDGRLINEHGYLNDSRSQPLPLVRAFPAGDVGEHRHRRDEQAEQDDDDEDRRRHVQESRRPRYEQRDS